LDYGECGRPNTADSPTDDDDDDNGNHNDDDDDKQ
jgi:hypothetical protein